MDHSYTAVLRRPGAPAFVTAGFVGRLPISMIPLGIVLLMTSRGADYAVAGGLSAVFALAAAFIGPFGARWSDRRGQSRTVPVLLGLEIVGLLLFVGLTVAGAAPVAVAAALVLAGGAAPNVGSLVRARWAALLAGQPGLRAAFAIEGVVDEVVFVVGPPLVTTIALSVSEPAALGACVLLLAVGVLWLAAQRGTQPRPHGSAAAGPAPRFRSRPFVLVVAAMGAMGAVFGAFEVTTVATTRSLGHEEMTGLILALYAVASLAAGLLYGARHLPWPLPTQFAAAGLVLVIVCAPLPFVTSLGMLAVAALLAGMAVSPLLIMAVAMVELLVPSQRLTEALTVATSGIAVGLAAGAPFAGWLIDTVGATTGYWVVLAGAAVTAALALVGAPLLRRSLAGSGAATP